MDIETKIDFTAPIELKTIFRTPGPDGNMVEYMSELLVTWDMIYTIQTYPFEDNWVKFPGPKFWVHLNGHLGTHLVLGSYDAFKIGLIEYSKYLESLDEDNGD